ncbi:alpha/beta fold hydrolase, partial [Planctomycetaceae bacterium AH-315-I19]|nr:alpha/beta fold hydrolase [Planctomycetaceae bacterium AH-315-I19]
MPAHTGHRILCTLTAIACAGAFIAAGPTPAHDKSDSKKNIFQRALADVRGSIDNAISSAKDVAHATYGIERFVRTDTGETWEAFDAADEDRAELPAHAVVLIHGLDEPGDIWADVAPALAAQGHEVFRFRYPNDGMVAPSADMFASWLAALRADGVACVDIVAHSMGGLVSYDMLTRDGLYGGITSGHEDLPGVRRLITIGTPWHGSALAPLRGVAEAREQLTHLTDSKNGKFTDRALRFLADGSGEAGTDITPGSAFLTELHERPGPFGTIFTTVTGLVESDAVRGWRTDMANGFVSSIFGKNRANAALSVFDGMSSSLGDGAVSESSAR